MAVCSWWQSDEHFKQMEEDAYEVVTNYVRAEELIQVKEEYSREMVG
ncbi:MAG: hypothetical protein J6L65_05265 [Lachnospiraceae bacterium]|nr:hypothetical protein [Lachnospiraceae bacterium]